MICPVIILKYDKQLLSLVDQPHPPLDRVDPILQLLITTYFFYYTFITKAPAVNG
jgi:hypothetical protein